VVRGKAISTLVIALFLIHPNLTQFMFDVFNCYKIEEDRRMKSDLQIICYKDYHLFWSLATALPSIVIWGIGIPGFAFLLLQAEKDRLHKIEAKERYGFLYNGYKKKFYYWEVIIMYRKILISVISVFIGALGTITQALFVFIFVIVFLFLNLSM